MSTMRDVAALAKVSAKTVSRVFNDDPHVRPETRARVEAALRELNYVPNTLATTFRAGRAPVVGIAVPDLVDPFFAAIAKSVAERVAPHGLSVNVTNLGDDASREQEIVVSLLRSSLSGLIIAPITVEQSYLRAWVERTPVVFVDRAPVRVTADSFTEDDHDGALAATTHLVEHGHRRIAFVGDTSTLPTSSNRLVGYRDALRAAGLVVDDDLVTLVAEDRASASAAVRRMHRLADPPSAVFSSNARCTMRLLPVLDEVPLALAGFGDFPLADLLRPAVTVIDQDPETLGSLAADRVLDRLRSPMRRYRRRTVLPVRLVERASCLGPTPLEAAKPRRSPRRQAG